MGPRLLKILYKLFRVEEEDSVESTIKGDKFITKIPAKHKPGMLKFTLDVEDIVNYIEEHPEGGRDLYDENALFGRFMWGSNTMSHKCSHCGEFNVYNKSKMEYETHFNTKSAVIGLCDDCEREIRQIICNEFTNKNPELIVDKIV